ncbi:TSUP family transporter [Mucilaginibacter paludis]|uniref:Probable membrane transporter protein n=1 Tax=Mucilaginibacter paludis DSM 18603 TaxID=714943 RepID=H1YCR2_9SPHI|nr:TSUP family transporter [Mucilaginibacter paludis]EHQ24249.1 siroheme synthase [Mucilaginibacter paludis DSM 18603]
MSLVPKNNAITESQDAVQDGNPLFPVFLKLNQLHTVLVGAGNIGLEKLTAILSNSAQAKVTIIAEQISTQVYDLAARFPQVTVLQKTFAEDDLKGANLVVVATGNESLNNYIREVAHQHNLLINVADKPSLCDFYLGSIVQKGDLKIAISTNGKSPTVAKRLKEVLNDNLPQELDTTLQQMSQLRETLSGDFASKVKKLNEVTSILVEPKADISVRKNFNWLIWCSIIASLAITITAFWLKNPDFQSFVQTISPTFYYFLAAGFVFAMIDGAIGMSYGVTSTTFSLTMGIPPATASMGVHLSEIMSNGIAGWMHYRMGNVNWRLFKLLLIPGIIGAVLGAYILSSLEHYSMYTKPVVSLYTLILGCVIFSKAFKGKRKRADKKIKRISLLGFGGGFIDAVGGGGWGSIVLSSLIAGGRNARFSLGTVKLSRFFIAMMSSLTFITMLSHGNHWEAVAGMIIGSALASPIAAKVSNQISTKAIMVSVAVIVILISLYSIEKFIVKIL